MSGGITYRLSPKERELLGDLTDLFSPVQNRLQRFGVLVRPQDPETKVTVEETDDGPRYAFTYPVDNDSSPATGRIYIKDEFVLSKDKLQPLSFQRSFSQDVTLNKRSTFWVNLAVADHPSDNFDSRQTHLNKLLEDLKKLPAPELNSSTIQNFSNQVVRNLHRPFPPNYKKALEKYYPVFDDAIQAIRPFNIRLRFGDHQSGITLDRKDDKILLSWTVVVDNEKDKGQQAEDNGRIYLQDSMEIDAKSHKVLSISRQYFSTPNLPGDLSSPFVLLSRLPQPPADSPDLQALVESILEGMGMGLSSEPVPSDPQPSFDGDLDKFRKEAKNPFELALLSLYERTAAASELEFNLDKAPKNMALKTWVSGLPDAEGDRQALHQAFFFLMRKEEGSAALIREIKKSQGLQATTTAILETLALLSEGKLAQATQNLDAVPRNSFFRRQIEGLLNHKISEGLRAEGLPLLSIAAAELLEKKISEDKAWLLPSQGYGDGDTLRGALSNLLKKASEVPLSQGKNLKALLNATPAEGAAEEKVRDLILNDPTLAKIVSIYEDPQSATRRGSLALLAFSDFLGPKGFPTTALSVLKILGPESVEAREIQSWVSGQASFAQKFERLLPELGNEIASPTVVASMLLAGGIGSVGKLSFFSRFGFDSRALRAGAELSGILLEAPTFVFSEKLLQSSFQSPDRQWDHLPRDLIGAVLAFGALRGFGKMSRILADRLEAGPLKSVIETGTWRSTWAETALNKPGRELPLRFVTEPILKKLGSAGISAEFITAFSRQAITHGSGLAGLVFANSLSRAVGLRESSQQGIMGNLVDDAMMYGNFILAGSLAQRLAPSLGLSREQMLLDALENPRPQEAKPSTDLAKLPDPTDPQDSKPSEAAPPTAQNKPRWNIILEQIKNAPGKLRDRWKARNAAKIKETGEDTLDGVMGHLPPKVAKPLETFIRRLLQRIGVAKKPTAEISDSQNTNQAEGPAPIPETQGSTEASEQGNDAKTDHPEIKADPNQASSKTNAKTPTPPSEKPEAFLEMPIVPLRTDNNPKQEWTLGRETPDDVFRSSLVEIPFANSTPGVEGRHAKISRVKNPASTPKKELYDYFVEPIDGKTFLNDAELSPKNPVQIPENGKLKLGEEGPSLTFKIDPHNQLGYLVLEPIPLKPQLSEWTLGREHNGKNQADVPFPASERQISRRHAKIVRDEKGRYFIQDFSTEGTFLNDMRVYGTQALQNKDTLELGGGMSLVFRLNRRDVSSSTSGLDPIHERALIPPPPQAEVHPAFRDLSPDGIQKFIDFRRQTELLSQGLGQDTTSMVLVAKIELPKGDPLQLEANATAWVFGSKPEKPKQDNTVAIPLPKSKGVPAEHVKIFLDSLGRFVLQILDPSVPVYVQIRGFREKSERAVDGREVGTVREWEKTPKSPKQLIEGWTHLIGTERIHLGSNYTLDFWPSIVASPSQEFIASVKGETAIPTPIVPKVNVFPSAPTPPSIEQSGLIDLSTVRTPIWRTRGDAGENSLPQLLLPEGTKVTIQLGGALLGQGKVEKGSEPGTFILKVPHETKVGPTAEFSSKPSGSLDYKVLLGVGGTSGDIQLQDLPPDSKPDSMVGQRVEVQSGNMKFHVVVLKKK